MIERSVIYYIQNEYTEDENHVLRATETRRKAYAMVESVTGAEWFNGGRNGLNPQYRFTVYSKDWHNEKIVEYNGTRYAIYRVYQPNPHDMELYAELRKGPEYE